MDRYDYNETEYKYMPRDLWHKETGPIYVGISGKQKLHLHQNKNANWCLYTSLLPVELPDIHQIRIFRMMVPLVQLHHLRINLTVPQHRIPRKFISHGRASAAGETAEYCFPVPENILQVIQPPFPGETVVS